MKVIINSLLLVFLFCSASVSIANEKNLQWSESETALLKTMHIDAMPMLPEGLTNKYADNSKAAALGHKLFFDKRFSANGEVACVSCHQPDKYFTDGLKTSEGIGTVKRNAPTIVGINQSRWYFLDGRADSLWSQALGPMENELEHGGNRARYAHIIYNDKSYRKEYESLFGKMPGLSNTKRFPENAGPVKDSYASQAWKLMAPADRKAITQVYVNMGKAIAAYEHKLRPAPSRADNYIKAVVAKDAKAMSSALDDEEAAGLKLFVTKANCVICHNGPAFSDFEFHNVGVPQVTLKKYDFGRKTAISKVKKSPFNCFGEYNDSVDKSCDDLTYIVFDEHITIGTFKTPSLRNISKTAPYMHAGQYETLSEVIGHYIDPPPLKLGENDTRMLTFDLDDREQEQLESFLKALDSDVDAEAHWLATP